MNFYNGMPGMGTTRTSSHRSIWKGGGFPVYLAGGKYIDGDQSGDPGNGTDVRVLRAGLLLGKITASGLYAPAIVGVTTGAYTSGGTTLTVSAAQAVELDRLVGQSGTAELVAVGPPSAAGTVAVTDVDHSAINTTTGDITVSSLGVNKIAGTFICVKDGRQLPVSLVDDDQNGVKMTDEDGTDLSTVEIPRFIVGSGSNVLDSSQIINWPSDTSLRAWIVSNLNTSGQGLFVFDHLQ